MANHLSAPRNHILDLQILLLLRDRLHPKEVLDPPVVQYQVIRNNSQLSPLDRAAIRSPHPKIRVQRVRLQVLLQALQDRRRPLRLQQARDNRLSGRQYLRMTSTNLATEIRRSGFLPLDQQQISSIQPYPAQSLLRPISQTNDQVCSVVRRRNTTKAKKAQNPRS